MKKKTVIWIVIIVVVIAILALLVYNLTGKASLAGICTDSDGGQDFFVKGVTNGKLGVEGSDYCIRGKNVLKEFYCEEDWVRSVTGDCGSKKCMDGKCA